MNYTSPPSNPLRRIRRRLYGISETGHPSHLLKRPGFAEYAIERLYPKIAREIVSTEVAYLEELNPTVIFQEGYAPNTPPKRSVSAAWLYNEKFGKDRRFQIVYLDEGLSLEFITNNNEGREAHWLNLINENLFPDSKGVIVAGVYHLKDAVYPNDPYPDIGEFPKTLSNCGIKLTVVLQTLSFKHIEAIAAHRVIEHRRH